MKCGYKWKATYLLAPNVPRKIVTGRFTIPVRGDYILEEQECVLPAGHDGPHRSLTNVTR
jgi:hypothetical protein